MKSNLYIITSLICAVVLVACERKVSSSELDSHQTQADNKITKSVEEELGEITQKPLLKTPDIETIFEGKKALESFLLQTVINGSEKMTEGDKESLKNLLIQWYWMSQTQGLYEDYEVTFRGVYWDFMSNLFPEIKDYVSAKSGERRLDLQALVDSWSAPVGRSIK